MQTTKNQYPFLISLSFLVSFIFIRLAVLLAGSAESEFAQAAKAGSLPETNFYIGSNIILFGYHIHHFYFGILLICFAAWIAIVGSTLFTKKHAAIMYGAGLGLFLDEIGLLLTWGDYYSSLSYSVGLFVLAIFLNFLFLRPFWQSFRKQLLTHKTPIAKALRKEGNIFFVMDKAILKVCKQETVSKIFTAAVYMSIGILVIIFPRSVYYFVVGLFFFQGVVYLAQAVKKKEGKS